MITQEDLIRWKSGELDGVNPRLLRGVELGVDPWKIKGSPWVKAVNTAITRAINLAERDRAWNNTLSTPFVDPFPAARCPYVFRKVQDWHAKIQREEELGPVELTLGLQAGSTIKEAIVQAALVKKGL